MVPCNRILKNNLDKYKKVALCVLMIPSAFDWRRAPVASTRRVRVLGVTYFGRHGNMINVWNILDQGPTKTKITNCLNHWSFKMAEISSNYSESSCPHHLTKCWIINSNVFNTYKEFPSLVWKFWTRGVKKQIQYLVLKVWSEFKSEYWVSFSTPAFQCSGWKFAKTCFEPTDLVWLKFGLGGKYSC